MTVADNQLAIENLTVKTETETNQLKELIDELQKQIIEQQKLIADNAALILSITNNTYTKTETDQQRKEIIQITDRIGTKAKQVDQAITERIRRLENRLNLPQYRPYNQNMQFKQKQQRYYEQ